MNWDKKSITATLFCFLFVMGYMYHLQNKYPDYYNNGKQVKELAPQDGVTPTTSNDVVSQTGATNPPPSPVPVDTIAPSTVTNLTAEELTFDTKNTVLRFDQSKASITEVRLKEYAAHKGEAEAVNLLDAEMIVQGTTKIDDRTTKNGYTAKREGNNIAFTRAENGWEITQTYSIPTDGYGFKVDVSFKNVSDKEQDLNANTLVKQALNIPASSGNFLTPSSPADVGVLYGLEGKRHDMTLHKACEKGAEAAVNLKSEKVDYVGFDKHYFLGLLWAQNQTADYLVQRDGESSDTRCEIASVISQKLGMVAPGASATMKLSGYFGPKQVDVLEAFGPDLKSSIKL
ncbi:MAG: hypothetical protein EOP07_17385, partial [Proteobacteria bacterium]